MMTVDDLGRYWGSKVVSQIMTHVVTEVKMMNLSSQLTTVDDLGSRFFAYMVNDDNISYEQPLSLCQIPENVFIWYT